MNHYGEVFINTQDMIVESDNNDNGFTLTKDTSLFFIDIHNENLADENWIFYLGEEKQERIFIPANLVNTGIKKYIDYYQEQFSHLNKDNSYFGQVRESSRFILIENGQQNYYEKIGDYITAEGVKYNAVKMPTLSHEHYWFIDDAEDYQDKEFFYFEPSQKIDSNLWDMDREFFKIPQPIEVSELVLQFPQMMEVIECLFKKQDLAELRFVYEAYREQLIEAEEHWQSFDKIPITQVQGKIEENAKEAKYQQILNEIELETAQFRQNLINKRLKF